MAEREENTDKPFEPTQRKLDDARKKGEIARSTDLYVTAAYAGMLLVAATYGGALAGRLGEVMQTLLDRPHLLAPLTFDGSPQPLLGGFGLALFPALDAFFGSDLKPGTLLSSLAGTGVETWTGHRPEAMAGVELVVASSSG